MSILDAAAPQSRTDLFGHPRGLTYLFSTEMWERFSYYGMVLLLPLYCLQYLLLPGHYEHVIGAETMRHALESVYGAFITPQQFQTAIYGAYTSLVYFTPLVGGFLADRWFGRRYTVVAGGLLMAVGHFLMAFENYFYFALLFLILGNGGFKPNISTQVGGLYRQGDHRIDRAYSIFYIGINVGAFIGQNICGAFGDRQMWSYGFAAAGIGMLIGTMVYLFALRILPSDVPGKTTANVPAMRMTREDWRAFYILWLLFIPGCIFWATWGQSGNTVEVWTVDHLDRLVNLGFTSFTLTVGFIQSVNSVFILLFTPLIISYWKMQERRNREPSAVVKMMLGFIILSISYLILAGAQWAAGAGKVNWIWSIVYFAVYTLGELYFSPVGLSLYSKAAPPQVAALMMAVFLATSFPGNFLGGWLGKFYSTMSNAEFFLFIAGVTILPVPLIWVFDKPLMRIMQHRENERLRLEDVPYRTPHE